MQAGIVFALIELAERPIQEIPGLPRMDREVAGPHIEQMQGMVTAEGDTALDDTRRLRDLLREKGYVSDEELCYVEGEGAAHDEAAWSARLPDALGFLLGAVMERV